VVDDDVAFLDSAAQLLAELAAVDLRPHLG
jgi:hypothetical protein